MVLAKKPRPLPLPPVPPNYTQGHPIAPKNRQRVAIPLLMHPFRLSKNSPFACKEHALVCIAFYSPMSSVFRVNKILHQGIATFAEEDANRVWSIADLGLRILLAMDIEKRKTIP